MEERLHTAPSPPQETPWALVLIVIGAGVAASFQIGKAPPVLTVIRQEFGMSLFLAGWMLGTFNVIGLALGPFSGALADALGHRRLLLLGLSTQAAASMAAIMLIAPVITNPWGWRGLWMANALILAGYALLVRALLPPLSHRNQPMRLRPTSWPPPTDSSCRDPNWGR